MSLTVVPITLAEANRYVVAFHRHNGPLPIIRFAVAAIDDASGDVHGVAMAGQPKTRNLDDGLTLEVNRVCTDGERNCCSFLYSRCLRAAKALGYRRIVTYTLDRESGASLKASGWTSVAEVKPDGWARHKYRPGSDHHDVGGKIRWEVREVPAPTPIWPAELERDERQIALWEAT